MAQARFSAGPPAGEDDAAAAAWDAFWGWDCCGPGGLCERVYGSLHIPRASWAGLKMLPAARAPLACPLEPGLLQEWELAGSAQ